MTGEPVEVFCDAGISPASMTSPTSSDLQPTLVGRIVILIPSADYGFIEQLREGILNKKGHPSSDLLEGVAVEKARRICLEKKLSSFTILTDSLSSANTARFPEVKWLEAGRLQLASLFLQRIVNRARYLRHSSRKVVSRAPPNEVQKDAFRLFNAQKLEFQLSKSALWNKIQSEIASANGSGQERLED
jgi:hypothetical protein